MPIRINGAQQPESLTRPSPSSQKGELDFNQIMSQTRKLQGQELQEFLTRLEKKGQQLAESFSLRDLSDFKDMVKSFLRSTFGQSRRVSEESFWDFQGRPKVLSRINDIDKALEELGQKVLDTQAKPLEILNQIDEIRGLIIDLFG
ncbi:MAG TPA: YaaR family protein [Desulfitobacterium dehalogenans]|uniref:YaaR family protein n=1 Tax=Desulfitobacterium dehalogenans TaxID=36854 RepID=A0A7C6Z250_9FIRM|nr:YaaR family protein [Desulfitobacterium dehalogenans]